MNIQNLEVGKVGLITQKPDGTIIQLGMTKDQSIALNLFVASLSKDESLKAMPEDYNLILKSELCKFMDKIPIMPKLVKNEKPISFQYKDDGVNDFEGFKK